jgi:hypothetical protein
MEILVCVIIGIAIGAFVNYALQDMWDQNHSREKREYKIKYNPERDKYEIYYGNKLIKQFMEYDEAMVKLDYYKERSLDVEVV